MSSLPIAITWISTFNITMWTCAREISRNFGMHPVFDTKWHDRIISCWGFHELINNNNNNNNTALTTMGMQIIISTQGYLSTQRIRCLDWSPGPAWTMWKLLTGVSPYNGQFDVVTWSTHRLPGGFVWEFFSRYMLYIFCISFSFEMRVCEV